MASGDVTTYYIQTIRGLPYVWKITGPCSSCGGSGPETQEWTYDDKGRVLAYEDGVGNVTSYTYDAETGDLLTESRVADPSNPTTTTHTTTYTYWTDGRVETKTEPNEQVTAYWYVAAGPERITEQVTATESRTTWFEYDTPTGKVWKVKDPLLRITEFHYTPVGDLEWVKDPLQHQTSFEYDSMGRRTRTILPVTTPANAEPTTTYDTLGRVYRITNPDNSYTEFTYDGGGHRTRVRDFLGRLTNYHYDAYGRLEKVTDADGKETVYGYDLMSHLTSIRDARLKTTGFEVDAYGRVTKVTWPGTNNRFEEFTYHGNGLLWTRKDRKSVTTTYGYDGLRRLKTKTYDNGAPGVTFTYDEGPIAHKGHLTTAANVSDTLTWEYDLASQVRHERSAFNNDTNVSYDYYLDGARKTVGLGVGGVGYDYDPDGRLWHITWGAGSYTFGYDDAHRRRSLTYPNGAVTTYTPDLLSRLENVKTMVGSNPIAEWTYAYNAMGNRTSRSAADSSGLDYSFDALDRLTGSLFNFAPCEEPCTPGMPIPREEYTYDQVGNRLTSLGSATLWNHSDRNELLANPTASFTYDLNGNLETKVEGSDSWTYVWSVENELMRVCKNVSPCTDLSATAHFKYDALGRRIQKVAGVTRNFTYDGEDILREKIVGVKNLRYVHGPGIDEPLAVEDMLMPSGTGLSYYHTDALGSIVSITNPSGAVTTTRNYFGSFGRPGDGADVPGYAFTGREWDPETGLYYYRARYYDPTIGRFLSEDPARFRGGANFYPYVNGDPVNVDPTGLILWKCSRKSEGLLGFFGANHVYFCNPATGKSCGKGKRGGRSRPRENEQCPGPNCVPIPDSGGQEERVLNCCKFELPEEPGHSGFGVTDNCWTYAHECLRRAGLQDPEVPGGMFGCPGKCQGCPPGMVPFKGGCRPE